MEHQTLGARTRDYLEAVVNNHELAAVDRYVSPMYRGSGHGWPGDLETLRRFYAWQMDSRPNWRIDVQQTVEVADCVVVRAHAGGALGADQGTRPTAAPAAVAVELLAAYRWSEGLITEIQVLAIQER